MFPGYLKRLLLFSLFIAGIVIIFSFVKTFDTVLMFVWVCYWVFFVLSFVTLYFSSKTMLGKFSNFMNIFFVSIFSKLILTAAIVMIFKSKNDTEDINFIIPFAIIYFSFLFFETYELVKMSRKAAVEYKQNNTPAK